MLIKFSQRLNNYFSIRGKWREVESVDYQKRLKNSHDRKGNKFNQALTDKIFDDFQTNPGDTPFLERNQIQTRIMRILYESQMIDLQKFKFSKDLRKDLNLDSLNLTVLLTSIEHEFTTVFQDRVFQSFQTLEEIVTILMKDDKII